MICTTQHYSLLTYPQTLSAHYRFCKAMTFISILSIRVLTDIYCNRTKSTVPLTSARVDATVWQQKLILVDCWPTVITYNITVILHVANKTSQCRFIATLSPFQMVRSYYSSPEAAASPYSFKCFTCGKSQPFCRKTLTSAKINRNINVRLGFDCT